MRVLGEIHKAGVRHRDLRPENMTIDNEGNVSIIDFDRADMNVGEEAQERERQHMLELFTGDFWDDYASLSDDRTTKDSNVVREWSTSEDSQSDDE